MSREFNSASDLMTYGSNVPGGIGSGAWTQLIVMRIMATADNIWISGLETKHTTNLDGISLGRHSNGLVYSASTAATTAVAWTDSDNWCVVASSKATGSSAPNHYKIPIGGATSTAAASAIGNVSASNQITLGGPSDPAHIRLAAAAIFTSALSQANIESVATAKTTQSILDLSPVWCVDDSDGLLTDLVGTADRTILSGTSDNADDPAGWVYFGGGANEKLGAGIIGP